MASYGSFPFASHRPTPNQSDKISFPEKIKQMLFQVNNTIKQFLDNLSYIYQTNGINFRVKEYQGALKRMLSPFQLLSSFGLEDNDNLFIKANLKQQDSRSYHAKFDFSRQSNEGGSQQIKIMPDRQGLHLKQQQKALQRKPKVKILQKQVQNDGIAPQKPKKINRTFMQGRQPILGQMEQELCHWIRQQVALGKQIQRADITRHAIQLSKNETFVASSGWFRRFKIRHPNIVSLLKVYKANRFSETNKLDGKVNKLLLTENENQHFQQEYGARNWYQPCEQLEEESEFCEIVNQGMKQEQEFASDHNYEQDYEQDHQVQGSNYKL